MSQRRLTRRSFLRGVGGAAVALPILNMGLHGTEAFGEGMSSYPQRLVIVVHPNGVIPSSWFPTNNGSETDFTLNRIHQPLASLKSKMTLLENVDMTVGGVGPGGMHQQGMGGVLTGRALNSGQFRGNAGRLAGWASGISIDQYLAQKVGGDTPFGSLELGVRSSHHGGSEVMTRMSYLGSDQPLPPLDNPVDVWNLLFKDAQTRPGMMSDVNRRRASVLDTLKDQLAVVRAQAGYQDKLRLDHHMTTMRELERRLTDDNGGVPIQCEASETPEEVAVDSETTMQGIFRDQLELLTLAFACDLTRVATFQISNAWNKITFPWIDSNIGGHTLSHAGSSNSAYNEQWTKRNVWYAQQLATFLQGLDEIPEGDGTLLDNTLFLWTSEVAVGNTHSWKNMPLLMAGSAGGKFTTGRHIKYGTTRSTNDLFVSILNAFGVEDETFGDPRFCTGPLSGLT